MPKIIEVDETEFQNGQQVTAAVRKLMAHPEAALLVEKARKLVEPDAPTPRLDAHKQANEPVQALEKKIADLEKSLADKDAEREKNEKLSALEKRVNDGNAKLRAEGWTEDGIKALDAFREKEGILDPVHAAAVYERLNGAQVAPVTPSSHFGRWDFTEPASQDEKYTENLLKTRGESESLATTEAMKALNEFRNTRR